jgi:hypothetical protein
MERIPGYENYSVTRDGRVINTNTDHQLKGQINNCGYVRVELSKDGKQKKWFVHRLVASAYLPNPHNLPQVNHKDGNKTNNCDDNLEWCDASSNHKHSFRELGRPVVKVYDLSNGKTKIPAHIIPQLVERKKTSTYRELAKELSVHPKYLSEVLRGKVRA